MKNSVLDFVAPNECPITQQHILSKDFFSKTGEKILVNSQPERLNTINRITNRLTGNDIALTMIYGLLSAGINRNVLKLVHQIKYKGRPLLGKEMGYRLGEYLLNLQQTNNSNEQEELLLPSPTKYNSILPVPLHKVKERERGFNQALVIAEGVSEVLQISIDNDLIIRNRYSISQTRLGGLDRMKEGGSAFGISSRPYLEIKGKSFLIIDDVVTTGATANGIAMQLLHHGAKRVDLAALVVSG